VCVCVVFTTMPAAMRPGDWACPSCGNHNYASKMACNKCQIPKGAMGGMGGMGAYAPMGGKGYGMMKGGASPYGKSKDASGMRPGDWSCPSCGNHNYADKMACNRCRTPKAAGMGMGVMGMGGMGMGGMSMMPGMMPMMGGAGQQRPGDWKCFACDNVNYASREQCNKCQVSKSTYIAKTGVRPGDWLCSMCQNHNYADKMACQKCNAPKGNNEVLGTNKMKQGDWLCPKCSNHNYADKAHCNRCQAPKIGAKFGNGMRA